MSAPDRPAALLCIRSPPRAPFGRQDFYAAPGHREMPDISSIVGISFVTGVLEIIWGSGADRPGTTTITALGVMIATAVTAARRATERPMQPHRPTHHLRLPIRAGPILLL